MSSYFATSSNWRLSTHWWTNSSAGIGIHSSTKWGLQSMIEKKNCIMINIIFELTLFLVGRGSNLPLLLAFLLSKLFNASASNFLTFCKVYFYTFSENFMVFKQWYCVWFPNLPKAFLDKNFKNQFFNLKLQFFCCQKSIVED